MPAATRSRFTDPAVLAITEATVGRNRCGSILSTSQFYGAAAFLPRECFRSQGTKNAWTQKVNGIPERFQERGTLHFTLAGVNGNQKPRRKFDKGALGAGENLKLGLPGVDPHDCGSPAARTTKQKLVDGDRRHRD